MVAARIFGIVRHRLTVYGEGVATLMAFSGCPLRCKYCLNKASWEEGRGRIYKSESLFEEVKIDQLYFLATHGGVTFGGGEPLLQVGFIKEFRALCWQQWQIFVVETDSSISNANLLKGIGNGCMKRLSAWWNPCRNGRLECAKVNPLELLSKFRFISSWRVRKNNFHFLFVSKKSLPLPPFWEVSGRSDSGRFPPFKGVPKGRGIHSPNFPILKS